MKNSVALLLLLELKAGLGKASVTITLLFFKRASDVANNVYFAKVLSLSFGDG